MNSITPRAEWRWCGINPSRTVETLTVEGRSKAFTMWEIALIARWISRLCIPHNEWKTGSFRRRRKLTQLRAKVWSMASPYIKHSGGEYCLYRTAMQLHAHHAQEKLETKNDGTNISYVNILRTCPNGILSYPDIADVGAGTGLCTQIISTVLL